MPAHAKLLEDGFSSIITFDKAPTVKLFEKEVTPPGWDGGGKNDSTTMRNTTLRTGVPKKLKTLTDASSVCAYHSSVLGSIGTLINNNGLVTYELPDDSTWKIWGWANKFIPNRLTDGELPTANVEVIPSNLDADGNEIQPVYTAPPPPPP